MHDLETIKAMNAVGYNKPEQKKQDKFLSDMEYLKSTIMKLERTGIKSVDTYLDDMVPMIFTAIKNYDIIPH